MRPRGSAPRAAHQDANIVPSVAIVASTLLWGTMWIPLRELDGAGLGGVWATAGGYILPLAILLPLALLRRRHLATGGRPLLTAGLLMAVCIALYSEALLRGYVARVMLLFYLTPVWSTLLSRFMLGAPITRQRTLTIALGLAGMLVVFGIGEELPIPRTAAEWMGLLSGFLWGLSMIHLRRTEEASDLDKLIVFFLFVGVVFSLFALIPGGRTWTLPTRDAILASTTWLLAFGLLWMPPVIWLTMYGGSRLDPGRVAILVMLEIVIGLATAALLTDEPFGARELVGAALILSAGAVELLPSRH